MLRGRQTYPILATGSSVLFVPISFTTDSAGDVDDTYSAGAPATVERGDPAEIIALANELRTDYEAHRVNITSDALIIALANELRTDYEAHRVLTAGSVHGAADSTNDVATAAATSLAEAYTLLTDIKTQYEAHRVLTAGGVHGGADSTNTISSADATTRATAIALANELRTDFNAHRVLTAGSVHGAADNTNAVTLAALATSVHGAADATNSVSAAAATTIATAYTLLNELKVDYNAHRVLTTGAVHAGADSTNTVTAANATTPATAIALANELRSAYEAHRVLTSSCHGTADATNAVSLAANELGKFRIVLGSSVDKPNPCYKLLGCWSSIGKSTVTQYHIEWESEDVDDADDPHVVVRVKTPTDSATTTMIAAEPVSARISVLLALQTSEVG